MRRAIAFGLMFCCIFVDFAPAASQCTYYRELSSAERQSISDLRFELASIRLDTTDARYRDDFGVLLKAHHQEFVNPAAIDELQALIAEAVFRRQIYLTLGEDNLAYQRLQVYSDLIIDHKAMDHKAYVNPKMFLGVRQQLEEEINHYFSEKQKDPIKHYKKVQKQVLFQLEKNQPLSSELKDEALKFQALSHQHRSMLGALDLVWATWYQRNQLNHTERMTDLAVARTSVDVAIAVFGFAGLIGYGPRVLDTARALWTLPFSITAGCAFGTTSKFLSNETNTTYLELMRALYKSVLNKTAYSCELGQLINPYADDLPVVIPDQKPPATLKDYLISCASVGTSMVFPKVAGVAFSGILAASITSSSYLLIEEAEVLLEEISNLHNMKQHQLNVKNQLTIDSLEQRIVLSQAKITLYMAAFGNTSVEILRAGLLLYGGREHLQDLATKVKEIIAHRPVSGTVDLKLLRIILGGIFQ